MNLTIPRVLREMIYINISDNVNLKTYIATLFNFYSGILNKYRMNRTK